jgi:hypothetical protein
MRKQAAHVSSTGVLPSTPDLSHVLRLHVRFLTRRPAGRPIKHTPTTPITQPLPGITRDRFSLIRFRSPLLSESRLFSLPAGTEMFHFPAFPPHTLYIQVRVTAHDDCRVSPFGHPRITARLTAPRGLSRPPTSFIGSWYLGIHRAPLTTWPQMLASTVQFSNNNRFPQTQGPTPTGRQADGSWIVRGSEPSRDNRPAPTAIRLWGRARSLRTQQRARPAPLPAIAFHALTGSTCESGSSHGPNSQRSTHEQPCDTDGHIRLCAP